MCDKLHLFLKQSIGAESMEMVLCVEENIQSICFPPAHLAECILGFIKQMKRWRLKQR